MVKPDTDFEESDSNAQQTAGPGSVEPDEDYGASDVDTANKKGSQDLEESEGEEVLYKSIQSAPSQNEFCRRPTRFQDSKLKVQFWLEGGRECNRLGRGDQAGSSVDNFCNFHKHTRKKVACLSLGRGEQQRVIRKIRLPTGSQSISPQRRETTTQRLSSREEKCAERQSTEWKRFLPKFGWPTGHETGFPQRKLNRQLPEFNKLNRRQLGFRHRVRKLNQRPPKFNKLNRRQLGFRSRVCKLNRQWLGFRTHTRKLNWRLPRFRTLKRQQLGFRTHTHKLNRRPPRFRTMKWQQLGFKARKNLVIRDQSDMHHWERPKRRLPELSSHVKFSKLNRSLRLGFRASELRTTIKCDIVK